MPWFFPWPDYIKKRACRYLLQHYLGNFLQEKLTLDQLSVDLYNGKGTIKDVALDVYSLNELLESVESPVEIIDGIIGSISISVPWSALLSDSCEIEIHGLELTLQPRYRTEENHAGGMFDSMWSSMGMTTSIQIAQECLKEEQSGKDHQPDKSQRYEGLELFAQTIESVLSRVKMTFVESVVKLEHVPKESKTGVSLEVCIKRIEYFDENASDPGSGSDQEVPQKYEPVAFALKKFHLMGVSLFCDEFPENYRTLSRQSSCESDSPIAMHTGNFSPPLSPPMPPQHSEMTARQPTYDSIHRQIEHGDPIKIASFAGRQEIKLKIKQNDRVTGPKVEIESFLGSINFFLSPRQVHLLLELAHGIASPSSSDVAPVPGRAKNKPMQPEDYDRIETELQEQLHRDRAFKQEGKRHSWTCQDDEPLHTQFLDDEEEIYFSMSASLASLAPFEQSGESDMESSVNSNFSVSTVDTNQTGNSSIARQGYGITYITSTGSPFASSIPKGAARRSHRPRKTLSELLDDPEAEMIRYKLKFSSIAMVILHENPLPSTSNNQQSVSMMTLSTSYFHEIGFGASVVGGKDYDELRERLAKACQHDHLQLIFAPVTLECDRKTSHSANAISADFSVGMLEVVEALYERSTPVSSTGTPNTENISPSYAEILTFTEEELSRRSMYTSLSSVPCFKIKVKNLTRNSGQGPNSRGSLHRPRTDIVMQFGRIRLDLDVTVVDRLNSLLHPVPLPDTDGHRNYKSFHHQNIPMSRQGYFSQAIDDTPSLSDQRIDIHVTCPFSVISVRFPIPDLRNDHERRPWWVRSLRKEILFLEVMEVGFYTKLGGSDQCSKYELTFKEMHGMLQEDPDKSPVSFIRIGPDQNDNEVPGQEGIQNGFNWPRIVVKVLPFESGPVLEEEEIDSEDSNQFSSLEDTMQFGKQEPSPFSSKKVMYDSEEMVIPGDQTEMADFAEKATNHSRMQLEFNLPNVSGFLPSKQFFELLYNRLLNDMLLWEPGAPSPAVVAEGHGVFASCRGFDFATQSLFNERFSMCKSLHANDSDSEEDSNQFDSILFESKKKKKKKSDPANFAHSQSYMAVSLNIGHGRLDLCLGAKEESGDGEKYGEAVLDFEDTNLFLVAKYQGNPDLSYLSLQANRVTMYHSGCVTPKKMSPVECVSSRSTPPHLNPCIYKSEAGAYTKLGSNVGSGSSNDSLNMLSVAIKINLDTKRKVKEIQVAIGIRGATLQHRVVLSEQSWISH
ncbi:autophagy-related protein 2 homolog B-like [Saccoglossus kowalevskii]